MIYAGGIPLGSLLWNLSPTLHICKRKWKVINDSHLSGPKWKPAASLTCNPFSQFFTNHFLLSGEHVFSRGPSGFKWFSNKFSSPPLRECGWRKSLILTLGCQQRPMVGNGRLVGQERSPKGGRSGNGTALYCQHASGAVDVAIPERRRSLASAAFRVS